MKLILGAILLSAVAPTLSTTDFRQSLDIKIPVSPSLTLSGGRSMVAFEVHATNFSDGPLTIHTMRIVDVNDGRPLTTYDRDALAARMRIVGASRPAMGTELVAGVRAVVYVELDLASNDALRSFWVEVDCIAQDGRQFTIRTGAKPIDNAPVPNLMPPMKTGTWVAVHDASWDRGHRRVIYTSDGRARIPGRYAIDWVGVDENGRISNGDPDRPADAVGYGVAVRAGADAVVAAVRNDMQEASSIVGTSAQPLGRGRETMWCFA